MWKTLQNVDFSTDKNLRKPLKTQLIIDLKYVENHRIQYFELIINII